MKMRAALIAGTALVGAVAWLPVTSLLLHGAVPRADPPSWSMPWPAYYYGTVYRGYDPGIDMLLPWTAAGAGLVSLTPALLVGCAPGRRRRLTTAQPGEPVPEVELARSRLHGNARWMTDDEARAKFPAGGDPSHGGIVIGQLDDGTLLIDPCDSGSCWLVFAGSRTGKTASITVPTLDPMVGWRGPVLVMDPAGEVSHMTRDVREAAGQRVVVIKPGQPGFNALDWIDIADPMASVHVARVVELIGKPRPKQEDKPMWRASGKTLQEAILLDLLWDQTVPQEQKTLAEFARRVATPEKDLRRMLMDIQTGSASQMARYRAGQVMTAPHETFGGYYIEAQTDINWLLEVPYAEMVSGGPMRSDDLVRGDLTVYVEIPMEDLEATPAVGRTVINALLQGIYRHRGNVAKRILVILEDVNLLGNMPALATARDAGAKFEVRLLPNWQAPEQIAGTWGISGKGEWQQNAAGETYIGMRGQHAAEEVSKRCGTRTALARTEGWSRGRSGGMGGSGNNSRNDGVSEIAIPLIRPGQVQQLIGRIVFWARKQDKDRPDENGPVALQCGNPFWYRQPGMIGRIKDSPFRRGA